MNDFNLRVKNREKVMLSYGRSGDTMGNHRSPVKTGSSGTLLMTLGIRAVCGCCVNKLHGKR